MAGMQCGTNNRQSFMPSQRPGHSRSVLTLLCQHGWDDQQAEQDERQGAFDVNPHLSFIQGLRGGNTGHWGAGRVSQKILTLGALWGEDFYRERGLTLPAALR